MTLINLNKSPVKELYYASYDEYYEEFEKGWSFTSSYSLIELRNIYLYLKRYGFNDLKEFTDKCIKDNLYYEKTPWVSRRILEQLNALMNFGLLTKEKVLINPNLFSSSPVDPLTKEDINVFKSIYFSYYRFREIHSWLISPDKYDKKLIENINEDSVINQSKAVFPFRSKDRLVDSFIFELKDNTPVYRVTNFDNKNSAGIKRFWDVYVKWGTSLGLSKRFNLSDFNYELSSNFKSPTLFYFQKNLDKEFSLINYLFDNFKAQYIYIPKLVLKLLIEYRVSLEAIKHLILDTARKYPEKVSLQKTSESLMKKTELEFIPASNGFLFSHILLLR